MLSSRLLLNPGCQGSRESKNSQSFLFFFFAGFFAPYRILVPQPRIESRPLAIRAPTRNHWTARELSTFPVLKFFFFPDLAFGWFLQTFHSFFQNLWNWFLQFSWLFDVSVVEGAFGVACFPIVADMCSFLSCVRLFAAPWTIQSMEFFRPEYWSG